MRGMLWTKLGSGDRWEEFGGRVVCWRWQIDRCSRKDAVSG